MSTYPDFPKCCECPPSEHKMPQPALWMNGFLATCGVCGHELMNRLGQRGRPATEQTEEQNTTVQPPPNPNPRFYLNASAPRQVTA